MAKLLVPHRHTSVIFEDNYCQGLVYGQSVTIIILKNQATSKNHKRKNTQRQARTTHKNNHKGKSTTQPVRIYHNSRNTIASFG